MLHFEGSLLDISAKSCIVFVERGDEAHTSFLPQTQKSNSALGERATDACNVVTELSRRHYVDDDVGQ